MIHRNNRTLVVVIIFCILECILILCDIYSSLNHNLCVYSRGKEREISSIFSSCILNYKENDENTFDENLITILKDNFPTSSSEYCFVAIDNRMIYLKDDNTTKDTLDNKELEVTQYLNQNGYVPKKIGGQANNTVKTMLEDNEKYLVSKKSITYGDEKYTLGICSKVDYIIKNNRFDILIIHIIIYLTLFVIAFISITFFLLQKVKKGNVKINEVENEMANNRLLVEKLSDKVEKAKNVNLNHNIYGFFQKDIVESILSELSPEQSKLSVKIIIKITTSNKETFINVATLLERFHTFKSVSCLWGEDEFMVLLLNTNTEEAEIYIQNFIRQYQIKQDQNIDDILFSIETIMK